jgi:flagellar motility protein MotE (MotC chaperone)
MPIGDPMAPPARSPYLLPGPSAGQVDVVSKAIKGMKPEQAAALIAHLDRTLAADVLQRMKPADAGAVLGFLRPEMGAALATEIANRPARPAGKGKADGREKL